MLSSREIAENVISNIHDREYSKVTYHLLAKYPDIDMNKLRKIADDIDSDTL